MALLNNPWSFDFSFPQSMKHLSLIIPVFNGVETIQKCLDSIFHLPIEQNDFEVIVIDDCSTDETIKIVEEFASDKTNLILLKQDENHRQGAARNRGMSIASGRYIAFIDSDDAVSPGIISALGLAEQENLEMVAMKVVKLSPDDQVLFTFELPYNPTTFYSGVELQSSHPFWFTGPCAYLYSNEFLHQVNYPFKEDVLFEDSDFVNVHLFNAEKMGYSDECGYIIHENPSSTTHTISYQSVCDYALLGTRLLKLYQLIEDKDTSFAESILEGGSYNIMRSFRNTFRLNDMKEVRLFYDRLDSRFDRSGLLGYRTPSYCWTTWTRFCLRHRDLASFIMGCAIHVKSIFQQK